MAARGGTWVLLHRGISLALPVSGAVYLGRSAACEIVLNDSLVSRLHAKLYIERYGVIIEDLGSANGVYVDSQRIEKQKLLRTGQRVVIGSQALELFWTENNGPNSGERPSSTTLDDRTAMVSDAAGEATEHGNFLDAIEGVVDHLLRHGDAASAERLVAPGLHDVLAKWKAGHATDAALATRAAALAVRLASKMNKGVWLDYVFELYAWQRRMMPADIVNALYVVVRSVDKWDRRVLQRYVHTMTETRDALGPTERFILHRLQGLAQMAT